MKKALLFLGIIFISSSLFAEENAALSSKIDKKEIHENQTVKLEISLVCEGGIIPRTTPPDLRDFKVIGISHSQKTTREENGLVHRMYLTYVLLPKKTGDLTIGPFTIKTPEKIHATEPITIKVKHFKHTLELCALVVRTVRI